MHGAKETSFLPRTLWAFLHLLLVGVAWWILFGGGYSAVAGWIGLDGDVGNWRRRSMLLSFGLVLWVRMTFAAFVLLKRKFGWEEFIPVMFACALYQIGFPLLGAGSQSSLDIWDVAGISMYVLGSFLNTGAELQRKRFKEKPENKGRLYTGGLFRFARHINYFGDSLWCLGWAILTRNLWALFIPSVLTLGFVFFFIPSLSRYLRDRYKGDFDQWEERTKAFFPFIY